VVEDPDRVRAALGDPAFVATFEGVSSHESLKRVPPGYPADHPMADLLGGLLPSLRVVAGPEAALAGDDGGPRSMTPRTSSRRAPGGGRRRDRRACLPASSPAAAACLARILNGASSRPTPVAGRTGPPAFRLPGASPLWPVWRADRQRVYAVRDRLDRSFVMSGDSALDMANNRGPAQVQSVSGPSAFLEASSWPK
jgi:hypothetical protein